MIHDFMETTAEKGLTSLQLTIVFNDKLEFHLMPLLMSRSLCSNLVSLCSNLILT